MSLSEYSNESRLRISEKIAVLNKQNIAIFTFLFNLILHNERKNFDYHWRCW